MNESETRAEKIDPLLKAAGISEVLGPGAPGTAVVDTIRAAANAS